MKALKYLLISAILLPLLALIWGNPILKAVTQTNIPRSIDETVNTNTADTTGKPLFPVAKTVQNNPTSTTSTGAIDLKTPTNINTKIEYDPQSGSYVFRSYVGEIELGTAWQMTAQEYQEYALKQAMKNYYRQKTSEDFEKADGKGFNLLDMQFSLGPADKIFGPGGVRIKTQGSAEIILGVKNTNVQNPTLTERTRNRTNFDFDEKIQLNVNAKVGEKVNFDLNYNTDATFNFDAQKIKLAYQGKEDEIIKSLELGNVSMQSSGSLIKGTQSLFGVKAGLQFGKLKVTGIIAQQESESKTVSSKGGVQMTPFDLAIDKYDENRHFFLAHYFRENYDQWMSKLPYISSGIEIKRIEVWVTNKRGTYDQARNILGFMDLAESQRIDNNHWRATNSSQLNPRNEGNTLYNEIITEYAGFRNISQITQTLDPLSAYNITGGRDFEKIENARRLESTDFTINKQLGYISLRQQLQPDESLAVSFEYIYKGNTYQVGEFSTDNSQSSQTLLLKLLKSSAVSPDLAMWHLMMKNVYSLNAYQVQKEKFRLDVVYQNDTTGTYLNYLTEGRVKNQILLRVMNLDRLDSKNEPRPDGWFDFVEGYTIIASQGKVIFPVVEPFGSHLRKQIGNDAIAEKYVFQELYDSTLTVAQQVAEKNKFRLTGEYKSSSGAEIRLNAMNVPRGSVRVTAGGAELRENVDYIVDYNMGVVTLLNQSIVESGTPVSVSLENQNMFNIQRKTLLGVDLSYQINPDFNIGGTVMNLSEKPLTQKVNMGDESINNTIWGLNLQYKKEFMWLTNLINKVPTINATAPSSITVNAEFAHLIPGHSKELGKTGTSYLDDFETSTTGYDIRTPYAWFLASTPDNLPNPFYNNKNQYPAKMDYYASNRSLLSWYYIDGLFTRKNSSLTPSHLKNDLEQLSNHYVREVLEQEIFPNKQTQTGESAVLSVLNLSYYPNERGPYNLDVLGMDNNGYLKNPEQRWGGMMRKMDNTDFEQANIEYIEFWLMDPFIYEKRNGKITQGGDLYFNLGEVSEDILRDGKKFFENGMPIDGDPTQTEETFWGKVPRRQSLVYAFDNTPGARKRQDIGLNGLSTEEELAFTTYRNYTDQLRSQVSSETLIRWANDPFSPINDPGGDNFHYYRGSDFDQQEVSILNRYKRYTGPEGNSRESTDSPESYDISSRTVPDVEDINQDNTLNEYERFFEYKISIRPSDTIVGTNYITDKRIARVRLRNGNSEDVTWFQFKIPVRSPERTVGSIRDLKTIRFMRMYLTDFVDPVVLRFGTLELIRGDWRQYTQPIPTNSGSTVSSTGNLSLTKVNIEENSNKKPVNYVLPPGISRIIDPNQPQLRQLNEQSLAMRAKHLSPSEAKAIYKNTTIDMRQYKRIQMFVHAEKMLDDMNDLRDGEMTVFMRLGSDYKNNYYEYEIPLKLTPEGIYSNSNDSARAKVWPIENMFDIAFELFTNLKLKRNNEKRRGNSSAAFHLPYSVIDPDKPRNKLTIIGNPSLSEVKTIMVGVRNNARGYRSAEIWINELRLTDFNEEGGWAAQGNMTLNISDVANVNVGGRVETVGFGGIEQSVMERRMDNFYQYNVSTSIDIGRLIPEIAKLKAPLYFAYSEQVTSPKYNPLDQDLQLADVLDDETLSSSDRDSIKRSANDVIKNMSFSMTNVRFDVKSKNPMPWDPANLTLGYAYSENSKYNPKTERELNVDYRGNLSYQYAPMIKPFKPFAKIPKKNKALDVIRDISIQYLPNSFSFTTNMQRNYYEIRLKDFSGAGAAVPVEPSYSKDFLWDRDLNIRWDLTKQIKFTYRSATNARIDETDGPVDRRFFPDEYEQWKDTVLRSLNELGTPLNYSQQVTGSFDAPLSKIRILNWMTASTKYSSTYNWDKGANIDLNTEIGNIIKNNMQWNVDARANFDQLYNKSKYLKAVNDRFSGSRNGNTNTKADTIKGAGFKSAIEHAVRALMLVRNASFSYRKNSGMVLPSFRPSVGAAFGQRNDGGILAPGLDFAFGRSDQRIIDEFIARNWLIRNDSLTTPSTRTTSEEIRLTALIEPFQGFKIDLNMNRLFNRNTQTQFMFDAMPSTINGNLTMTYIAIGTSLRPPRADNSYQSAAFDQFLRNREIIARRVANQYVGTSYPSTGFFAGTEMAGKPFNPNASNQSINLNSPDVLIPAFLAAYSGQDASKSGTAIFPSIWSMLPNWKVSYDGLMQIPFFRKHLKSFNLSHAYRCTYGVNSFDSYAQWVGGQDDLGFIRSTLNGEIILSSPYDITSVTINESFAPLIGFDLTLKNNIQLRFEYKDSRVLNLNMASFQIMENLSNDYTIGAGYKITDLKIFSSLKGKQGNFQSDLNLRADISYRQSQVFIRKIEDGFTQPTSGTSTFMLKLSADYALSKAITLRAFFDQQSNKPLVSSTSYPVTDTSFGLSIRFTLTQ